MAKHNQCNSSSIKVYELSINQSPLSHHDIPNPHPSPQITLPSNLPLRLRFPLITPRPRQNPFLLIPRPLPLLRARINHHIPTLHTRPPAHQPPLFLTSMLTLMSQLRARLPLPRVSQAPVHIRTRRAPERGARGRFRALFAVQPVVVRVEGLSGRFGDGVWSECAVGGGGAWGQGFGGEFGGGVVADEDAGFVLWGEDVSWTCVNV